MPKKIWKRFQVVLTVVTEESAGATTANVRQVFRDWAKEGRIQTPDGYLSTNEIIVGSVREVAR